MKVLTVLLLCSSLPLTRAMHGYAAPGQTGRAVGVVISIDSTANLITIKTDAGPELKITFEQGTKFLRVAPGATNLENAASIPLSELNVGDRILARGKSGGDPGSFLATTILIMSKADLAKKHAAERAEWDKRGIGGVITALNPSSNEVTITVISNAAAKPMVIVAAPGSILRRYSANSVKFSDARPSRFEEFRIGDQIRALGTFNEDRTRFIAEEIVSGSFQTIAAVIVELNAAKSTIIATNLVTKKPVEVQITTDSTVRRLSPQVVQSLASRNQAGGPATTGSSGEGDRSRSSNAASSGVQSVQQSSRDLQTMMEKLPPQSLSDLKAGDAVLFSCTNSEDPSRVTAITLLSGVEPLLKPSSRSGRPFELGSWNLDLNMNVGVP